MEDCNSHCRSICNVLFISDIRWFMFRFFFLYFFLLSNNKAQPHKRNRIGTCSIETCEGITAQENRIGTSRWTIKTISVVD